jgi:hypothetical protein
VSGLEAQTPAPAPQTAPPLLRIVGLAKTYPGGQRALAGVDLALDRPQVVALIG